MKRRYFIRLSALFGLSGVTSKALSLQSELTDPPYRKVGTQPDRPVGMPIKNTPSEIQGPFYPLVAQSDKDFDLTKIKGKSGVALGTHAYVEGAVFDISGNSIEGATVDLWQANSRGRYRHPHDSSNAPLDENFQGWAIVKTNKYGRFRFKTVIPGPYSVSSNWQRPPHIHFKVSKLGYEELVTQMYFAGQALNTDDRLLHKKSPNEQELMIAKKAKQKKNGLDVYRYDIVLNPV